MALIPIPRSLYPNVPKVAGVPPVLRQIGAAQNAAIILVSDVIILARMFLGPQWGIFGSGNQPLIVGDSVRAMEFRNEWHVANYPLEQGAFESYNKVQVPFDVRMTFMKGGMLGERTAFLASVENAARSLDLLTAITPEQVYPSVNIVHYDMSRTVKSGATLLSVDVWLQHIRVTGSAQFTQTKSTNGTPATNQGVVQTGSPTETPITPSGAPI